MICTTIFAVAVLATSTSPAPEHAAAAPEILTTLVDVTTIEKRWSLDIKYATTDNFTGKVLYPAAKCLLRPKVASMVQKAQAWIDDHHAGYTLLFKDCYRPLHVQKTMWQHVRGTPQQSYVANPYGKTGSVHNYGCAVDLTLSDSAGKEVDMGTAYDHLGRLSQPRHEDAYVKSGDLTAAHVSNRRMLRRAMVEGGKFKMIRNEWWHFDAWQGRALRSRYKILDLPLDDATGPQ